MTKNLFLSNIDIDKSSVYYTKLIMINLVFVISFIVYTVFAILNFFVFKNNVIAGVDAIFILPSILGFIYLRKTQKIIIAGHIATILLFISMLAVIHSLKSESYSLMWSFIFPLMSYVIQGNRKGLYYNLLFYAILFLLTFSWIGTYLTHAEYIRFIFVSVIINILAYFYESSVSSVLEIINSTLSQSTKYNSELIQDLTRAQKLSKIGSWRYDHKGKKYTYSEVLFELLELKNEDEFHLSNLVEYIYPDDTQYYNKQIAESITHSKTVQIEYRLLLNGNIKYVREIIDHQSINGELLFSNGTIQDITAEKNFLKQLREKDRQLLHQSRLALMGEMLSMIAHQWRQPLSAITSIASNVSLKSNLHQLNDDFCNQKSVEIIELSKHLSQTINDFSHFFKPNYSKSNINIHELIQSSVKLINESLKSSNIILNIDIKDDFELYTYVNELRHVILNIIKNAEDAIKINTTQNPQIFITCFNEKNHSVIEIRDNGGGIDEEIIYKIFDPYFSTKSELNGTGLGLYMSKVIIEEHCNGSIDVQNIDNGVKFSIRLEIE